MPEASATVLEAGVENFERLYIHQVFLKLQRSLFKKKVGELSDIHKHAHSFWDKEVLPEHHIESRYQFIRKAIKQISLIIEDYHSY